MDIGALSLLISEKGFSDVMKKVGDVDTAARRVGSQVTEVKLAAPTIAPVQQSLASILKTTTGIAGMVTPVRFDVSGARQAGAVVADLAAKTRETGAAVRATGGLFVTAGGQASEFAKKGLTATTAVAFGLGQLAAQGETSIRSIATAVSSFAIMFGPTGVVVSAISTAVLVVVDFFRRTRDEAEATFKAIDDAIARRRPAQEVLAETQAAVERRRAQLQTELAALRPDERRVDAKTGIEITNPDAARAVAIQRELTTLKVREAEITRQLSTISNDARIREIEQLGQLVRLGLATNDEKRQAVALEGFLRSALLGTFAANEQGRAQRLEYQRQLEALTGATKKATDAERERTSAIAEQVGALVTLAGAHKVEARDLGQALELDRQLRAEYDRTNTTLRRRAEIVQQLNALAQAALAPGQGLELADIRAPRPQAERELRVPLTLRPDIALATDALDPLREQLGRALERAIEDGGPAATEAMQRVMGQVAKGAQITPQMIASVDIWTGFEKQLGTGLRGALTGAISDGFRTAVESGSIAAGFSALGGAFLSGLGGLLIQIGEKALASLLLLDGISKAIAGLVPGVGIPLAFALIALGASMQGAGARGSRGGGGSASGSPRGSFGSRSFELPSIPTSRVLLDPDERLRERVARAPSVPTTQSKFVAPVAPVTVNATFLGRAEPQHVRWIADAVREAHSRNIPLKRRGG